MSDQIVRMLPILRRHARSLVANPAEADELVARTLLRAIGKADELRPEMYLEEWLLTLMIAECEATGPIH